MSTNAATPLDLVPPLYPQELEAKPTTVLVTGACGYIAANTVKRLLAAGHTVHGTVRDLHSKYVAELEALPGAKQRLKLFKADLLKPEGWKEAMEGCTVVLHLASPYRMDAGYGKAAQEQLVEPAVKGTEHVLNAANETPSVRRVVQTSSCAAVVHSQTDQPKGYVFDEKDWNTRSNLNDQPYHYSKTLAERKGWEIASEQSQWDLIVINPSLVWGPPAIARGDGESVKFFKKLAGGDFSPACPVIGFGQVDVRDVAAMHCVAAFEPKAHGRYLATGDTYTFADLARIMSELYPKHVSKPWITVPRWLAIMVAPLLGVGRDVMRAVAGGIGYVSNEKAKTELGVTFLPMKQTLKDMGDAMEQFKLIKPLRR